MIDFSTKTILLVEDEAVIALAESAALKKHGFTVVMEHSGELAVERALADDSIDLILMDMDLGPGLDGTGAARAILEKKDLPVLFLSNHTGSEVVEKAEKITSYGYVVKNTGETVLLASIKMAFRLHDAHRREKENERALIRERENLRAILDASPAGMLVIDDNEQVVFANAAASTLFGTRIGESWRGRCGDFFQCENRGRSAGGCGSSDCCGSCSISRAVKACVSASGTGFESGGDALLRLSPPGVRMWVKFRVRGLRLDGHQRVLLAAEDITDRVMEKQALEKLVMISERFLQSDSPEVDFKLLSESLIDIAGAKYAIFSQYDEDGSGITVRHISGDAESIGKAAKILGFAITGKTWPPDRSLERRLDGRVVTRFPSLSDVTGTAIPGPAVLMIEKLFDLGETVVIKVRHSDRVLGAFKLLMPRGAAFRNEGILEVFARQVGLLLMRKRAEQSLAAAAEENAILLRELQHRVKNSLSMIHSLIHLESGRNRGENVRPVLKDIENRVMVLSNLYGLLNEGGTMEIRLDSFLSRICGSLTQAFAGSASATLETEFAPALMDAKRASSVGLMLNELVTNAFKYAFSGGKGGRIRAGLTESDGHLELTVSDDGAGLPEGFDPERIDGFGFKLVGMLASQLQGTMTWNGRNGTAVRVRLPR